MTELELLRKEIHDTTGFNISMMINKYKKDQRLRKSTYEVPDSVFCAVCREYLKRGDKLGNKSYPYFMKVLVLKAHEERAKEQQKEAKDNKFKRSMPEHLKAIMGGV